VRLSGDARKMVVFFGVASPPNGETVYRGTGFIGNEVRDGKLYSYLITCGHVARALSKHEEFFIRVNLKAGGSEAISVRDLEWAYHVAENVDLAVGPTVGIFDNRKHDLLGVSLDGQNDAACGDRVHLVGLFRLRAGSRRNMPIVHTGHIAALADPDELIPSRLRGASALIESEVHLVEAQTLEGLSGSPVFIQRTLDVRLGTDPSDSITGFGVVDLFGIYQGAWDGRPGEILEADRSLNGNLRVPVGMGLVVPIQKVREMVEKHPIVKMHRESLDAARGD
jgi:hypothetical protein